MRAPTSAIVGAALMLALGVTGCAAHGPVTTGTPPPPATAGPASGATSATFGSGSDVTYPCDQLLDDVTLGTLDANLTADADFQPASGSSADEAVSIKGTACSWSDASSQTTLVVTAAQPDAATLAALKTRAGTPTTQFGSFVSAYTSGTTLQIFNTDGYWATADSPLLADPAKLTTIGQALIQVLPAG
ncbi:MAG: hypothetical protein ABIS08_00165 [Pseudolysinimonas sp.]